MNKPSVTGGQMSNSKMTPEQEYALGEEFNALLNKMREKSTSWQTNLIDSSIGWNPQKIDSEYKKLLLSIGSISLNDNEVEKLKKLLKV